MYAIRSYYAEKGELLFGTVDTYLLWRLTGGKVHATDATNASRTMLYNISEQCWDEDLLKLFTIPVSLLPEVKDCAADFRITSYNVCYTKLLRDVPVDAFWSITVYNDEGYLEANDLGINSYNNFSAKPNEDGSYTFHFGGNPKSINYLPITNGWNYAVRMYKPRRAILDGSWKFPNT